VPVERIAPVETSRRYSYLMVMVTLRLAARIAQRTGGLDRA
jgi:hypothetical protein